jgi:hypothetical protein
MRAIDELVLLADKIARGNLPADEPLFVLRGQDADAADTVRFWASRTSQCGTPREKCDEARALAKQMDAWPVKQTAGRPETRVDSREVKEPV